MKNVGIALLITGAGMLLFGLLSDASVAGTSGMGRVNNLGLLAAKSGAINAGGSLLVAGAVFYAGGGILEQLDLMRSTLLTTPGSGRAVTPAGVAESAASDEPGGVPVANVAAPKGPRMSAGADGWRAATAYAEEKGWRVTSGFFGGVTLRSSDGRTFTPRTPQDLADTVAEG